MKIQRISSADDHHRLHRQCLKQSQTEQEPCLRSLNAQAPRQASEPTTSSGTKEMTTSAPSACRTFSTMSSCADSHAVTCFMEPAGTVCGDRTWALEQPQLMQRKSSIHLTSVVPTAAGAARWSLHGVASPQTACRRTGTVAPNAKADLTVVTAPQPLSDLSLEHQAGSQRTSPTSPRTIPFRLPCPMGDPQSSSTQVR